MQPPILLAFGFSNLAMLGGMAAASIPIILHLLNRRRKFRQEPWAAMRFLLAAIRKNQKRVRIEQLLLLAVRTLIIMLVVAVMAKPFLENGGLPILAGQRTHRVIVLDGSLSMAYTPADASRFDQAKELAARLVKAARRGDAISVVLMADPPKVLIKEPSANHAEVLKELADVTLPHGGTDLTATLAAVDRVLDSSDISQKEVVFLTDVQAASWKVRRGAEEGLKRAVAKLEARKDRMGSVVIDLGSSGASNRAVVDLKLGAPIVTPGMTAPSISATVQEFGREALEGVRVRLLVDGQIGPDQIIFPRKGEAATAVFSQDFLSAGDHVIEAVIDDDPLKIDNHRWLAVPVREAVRVLLVDGDPKNESFHSETDFLAVALSPESDSNSAPSTIKAEVVPMSRLASTELSPYDVVVLCNVGSVNVGEVSALEAFLKQGGGVVVFGGDQVVPDNYNRLLFAGGKGLLPAEIGPTVGSPEKNETPFQFKTLGFKHPIIAEFAGAPEPVVASLTGVNTGKFHKLKLPAKDSNAQVALAFENDDPAIIEAPRFRGTVIQVATSADRDWTTWPIHLSYPPIMERIIFQAASGRMVERNVRVGQPLDQALPPSGSAATASVRKPDGKDVPVKLQAGTDVSRLFFEGTDLSGLYQVKIGAPLSLDASFSANPDPIESDPAKLDRAGLAEAVPGWTFAYFNDPKNLLSDASAVSRRGELHRPLLWAVLALLVFESVLAWWFGHHR